MCGLSLTAPGPPGVGRDNTGLCPIMPRALLSVSDKTGIVDLGRGLAARGFELVSTGGTARALTDAGLAVTSVSDVTGFPEMMDGRVKTLHPALHGGILARRDRPDDLAALARHGIGLVDVVVVNLYPFAQGGGESGDAVRDAGRGDRHRRAVAGARGGQEFPRRAGRRRPGRLPAAARRARSSGPTLGVPLRADAQGVRAHRRLRHGDRARRCCDDASTAIAWRARRPRRRHVRPTHRARRSRRSLARKDARSALRREPASAGRVVCGRDRGGARASARRDDPAGQGAVVHEPARPRRRGAHRRSNSTSRPPRSIKHTNPCGAATGESPADAYVRARDADSLAAFGGIVGAEPADRRRDGRGDRLDVHRSGDRAGGGRRRRAPILAKKANMRVVTADFDAVDDRRRRAALDSRRHAGAGARSSCQRRVGRGPGSLPEGLRVVTKRAADRGGVGGAALCLARLRAREVEHRHLHRRAAHAGDRRRADEPRRRGQRRGDEGAGRRTDRWPDRSRRPMRSSRSATASTPSPGPGATAVVQPGGSVRDAEVIAAADEHGLAMVFTGRRHFRH